jgi:hypothetical protein
LGLIEAVCAFCTLNRIDAKRAHTQAMMSRAASKPEPVHGPTAHTKAMAERDAQKSPSAKLTSAATFMMHRTRQTRLSGLPRSCSFTPIVITGTLRMRAGMVPEEGAD